MTITSHDIDGDGVRREPDAPLFDFNRLDDSRPLIKKAACVLGWGNSAITTIATTLGIQHWLYGLRDPRGALAGIALAAILFAGQIYTLRKSRSGYAVFLTPDALMTAWQWCNWILIPLAVKLAGSPDFGSRRWVIAVGSAAIIGGVGGIVSARLPEKLAFGRDV